MSGLGDINDNGSGDILVGAPGEAGAGGLFAAGAAYVFDGSTGDLIHSLVSPYQEIRGSFGNSVSSVPDLTGDGIQDIVVAAREEEQGSSPQNAGRVYVFDGATGKFIVLLTSKREEEDGDFGKSVSGVPDANGDALGDIVVGAYGEDPGSSPDDTGRAYLFTAIPIPTPSNTPGPVPSPTPTLNCDVVEGGNPDLNPRCDCYDMFVLIQNQTGKNTGLDTDFDGGGGNDYKDVFLFSAGWYRAP